MIHSFGSKEAEDFYRNPRSKYYSHLSRQVKKGLLHLSAAKGIEDLLAVPGLRLHKLSGDKKGMWAVNITASWRIVFQDMGSS